jgi:ribulose-bisphosphate carboxylase small chain
MWGHPMFDIRDAKAVLGELAACRRMHEECYIRLCAFDSTHTWESLRLSFIVQRPSTEPGFMLARHEAEGRTIRYETRAYVMEKPEGSRYGE